MRFWIEQSGAALGWIVNIIQLIIWSFELRKARKKQETLDESISVLNNDLAEARDFAARWQRIALDAAWMLRDHHPKTYEKFASFHGGVEQMNRWWKLPEQKEL